MSQPEISPLARRLAEENNVDWRDLHGSGAGGKVVERDVLEFLARVMAGEEDLDPTPEPVPEGMEAWPEDDVHSFQQQMRDASQVGGLQQIQQELSASDRLAEGVSEPDAAPHHAEPFALDSEADAVTDGISEDIFLFDDEEDAESTIGWPGVASSEDTGWEAVPSETDGEPEDELLVAGEDSGVWDGGPAGDALDAEDTEALGSGAVSVGAPDNSLPDLFVDEGPVPEPRRDAGSEALFDEGATPPADGGSGALEMPPLGDLDLEGEASVTDRFDELRDTSPEDESFVTGFEAGFGSGFERAPQAQDSSGTGGHAEEPLGATAADEVGEGDAIAAEAVANDGAPPVEPAEDETTEVESTSDAWISERVFEPDRTTEREADRETAAEPSSRPVEEASAAGETALPPLSDRVSAGSAGSVPSELPLVSYGTLLRRHLDVTALASAQLAVGLELGESEPLAPGPFLLRAAAKAVADGGWGDGPVAAVGWDERGELRVARIAGAVERPFIDLAHDLGPALAEASSDASGVSLAVVDMSALDVDEAVLNVDAPLLTLGRILYDNQRGSYRSTLSLAGDVPPERGARLLARVAELLDAPVRLLL